MINLVSKDFRVQNCKAKNILTKTSTYIYTSEKSEKIYEIIEQKNEGR